MADAVGQFEHLGGRAKEKSVKLVMACFALSFQNMVCTTGSPHFLCSTIHSIFQLILPYTYVKLKGYYNRKTSAADGERFYTYASFICAAGFINTVVGSIGNFSIEECR